MKNAAQTDSSSAASPGNQTDSIRFSLRGLMIAVTSIAVLLAVLRQIGILGAVVAFLATTAFTCVIFPALAPNKQHNQRLMFDFLWGVVMPIICFVFDPLIFKTTATSPEDDPLKLFDPQGTLTNAHVHDLSYVVYALVGWQTLVMTAWLIFGIKTGRYAAFFGGMLAVGFSVAAVIGLVLAIPAILGVYILGIGLLGLTPLITAYSYWRQYFRAMGNAWQPTNGSWGMSLAIAGFCTSIIIPLALGAALLAAFRGKDAVLQLLR